MVFENWFDQLLILPSWELQQCFVRFKKCYRCFDNFQGPASNQFLADESGDYHLESVYVVKCFMHFFSLDEISNLSNETAVLISSNGKLWKKVSLRDSLTYVAL